MLLWVLFTSTLDAQELIVGSTAAGLATIVAELVRRRGLVRFRCPLRWVLEARRLPGRVASDSLLLVHPLWRAVTRREPFGGRFWAVPFEPGGDDARSATRRALVVAAISLTPNTYVLGIDRDKHIMLTHQLVASPRESAVDDIVGWL
jgi:multisubunit Na+/H+ antiporter MnhE subunit